MWNVRFHVEIEISELVRKQWYWRYWRAEYVGDVGDVTSTRLFRRCFHQRNDWRCYYDWQLKRALRMQLEASIVEI